MGNDECGTFVRDSLKQGWKGMKLSDVCAILLDECLDKGSRDNMSAGQWKGASSVDQRSRYDVGDIVARTKGRWC